MAEAAGTAPAEGRTCASALESESGALFKHPHPSKTTAENGGSLESAAHSPTIPLSNPSASKTQQTRTGNIPVLTYQSAARMNAAQPLLSLALLASTAVQYMHANSGQARGVLLPDVSIEDIPYSQQHEEYYGLSKDSVSMQKLSEIPQEPRAEDGVVLRTIEYWDAMHSLTPLESRPALYKLLKRGAKLVGDGQPREGTTPPRFRKSRFVMQELSASKPRYSEQKNSDTHVTTSAMEDAETRGNETCLHPRYLQLRRPSRDW